VCAMPDGTNVDDAATAPGTPEEQIRNTAAGVTLFETVAKAMSPILGIFGADAPVPTSGGGGGGGAYMFASVEELDGVIQQWESLIEDIKSDNVDVDHAVSRIDRPAGDEVSAANYRRASETVTAMQKHNNVLLEYAAHYKAKLEDCRAQMVGTEQGNQTRVKNVY
jgi:hypothetical protein